MTNGIMTAYANGPIAAGTGPFWLQLKRTGNTWTGSWSTNGTSYNTGATVNLPMTTTKIGPFASNWQSPASAAPAFTAAIDYFHSQ
jgi:hypothetical protein